MSILLLVLGLLLFVGLVVIHEFGHFIAARRNGVEVEEFGVGFPPRAKVLKKKNGTVYTLNWLPLGGFVRLKGENDDATEPGSYGAARLKDKVKILLAGVGMNLAAAFVLLTIAAAVGIPKLLPNQFTIASDTKVVRQDVYIGYVEEDSPAERAGLQVEDRIKSIRTGSEDICQGITMCAPRATDITTAELLSAATETAAGRVVSLTIERDGQLQTLTAQLRSEEEVKASQDTDNPKGYLGVAPAEFQLQRSTWSSPVVAAGLIGQFTVETFKGIGAALGALLSGEAGRASEQVSGPVGVFVLLRDGSVLGPEFVIFIIAVISLTLAIMNVLPIPALDGGRLFVTLLFRAFKKPLTKEAEDKIHGIGFVSLLVLFALITIVDVRRFF